MSPLPLRKGFIFVFQIFLVLFSSCSLFANEYEEAYQQTQEQFQAAVDTVDQTKEKIDDLTDKLSKIEEFVKNNPSAVPNAQEILAKINEASEGLKGHAETLDKFSGYAGKVKDAFDVANELVALRDAAKSRAGGNLAEAMHYIATAMEQFGEKVPLIGPAVKAYGEATLGMLDATDKAAQKINETRNQGMIGAGTYGGADDEKYQKLVKQFGTDFASGQTFVPSSPGFVYRPTDDPNGDALIWDAEKGEWYRVPGNVPVEKIFHDNLVSGRRRDPSEIRTLAEHYDQAHEREGQADQIRDFFNQHGGIPYELGDAEGLLAGFTYDQNFNRRVKELLEDRIKQLQREGKDIELKELTDMLERTGIQLPNWPPPKEDGGENPFGTLETTGVGGIMGGGSGPGAGVSARDMGQGMGNMGSQTGGMGGEGHAHTYGGGRMRDA